MKSKIFISFLGPTQYTPCKYEFEGRISSEVTFVQAAIAELILTQEDFRDCFILMTNNAKVKNWDRLSSELNGLGLNVHNKDIPEGFDEESIWQIFDIIYNLIDNDSEIIPDITHGFRSLPLLGNTLINYSKVLKNIKVKKILYGAFDARNKQANDAVPLLNLVSFSTLNDWSYAANSFLYHGTSEELAKLLREEGKPFLDFTNDILTTRSLEIISGESVNNIQEILNKVENSHPAIKPILKKVSNLLRNFKKNNPLNLLEAVKWCVANKLTQQGYTLLSEFLITFVLMQLNLDYKDKDIRELINGFLMINGNITKFNFQKFNPKNDPEIQLKYEKILEDARKLPGFNDLCRRAHSINSYRNDINHAGTNNNPRSAEKLQADLKDKLDKLEDIIKNNYAC